MTFKELTSIYGEDAYEMASVLPKKKHPLNPKVMLYMNSKEKGKLMFEKIKTLGTSTTSKIDSAQAQAIKEAMDVDIDNIQEGMFDDKVDDDMEFKGLELDEALLPGQKKIMGMTDKDSLAEGSTKRGMDKKFDMDEQMC